MQDLFVLGFTICLMALALMGVASTILSFFIGLWSPPSQRAGWTVGVAYVITTAIFLFGGIEGYEVWGALAGLPASLIAFWYWRMSFRRAWINEPDILADGESLEDDDWRIGLLRLMILVVLVVGVVVIRVLVRGM